VPGVAAKQQVRSVATGLLPLRAVVVVEDDALGFEDADDIDRGLRVVLAGGFVYLDVDDDRFQIPAFLVEEPLAVGPVGGVGHVVDHLPVQGGADPDTCDRHELAELLLGELLPELGGEFLYDLDEGLLVELPPGHVRGEAAGQ